ncbi:MAG TPA: hypothetical protein VFJ15_08115 [Oleiagrimonas sp.]|nr:hypothetical protein [Oleiagrimonas sp.]
MATLYRRVQVGVRKTAPRTSAKATGDMISQACHDVIVDSLVLHKGHFHCHDCDPDVFDDKLAGYLVKAAINRILSAERKHAIHDYRFGERVDDGSGQTPTDGKRQTSPPHSPWRPDSDQLHVKSLLTGDSLTAADQQRAALLSDCINRLTDMARKTYELALTGSNDHDIQAELDVASASTVRRRVHDAHKKVIDCVQRKIPNGGPA